MASVLVDGIESVESEAHERPLERTRDSDEGVVSAYPADQVDRRLHAVESNDVAPDGLSTLGWPSELVRVLEPGDEPGENRGVVVGCLGGGHRCAGLGRGRGRRAPQADSGVDCERLAGGARPCRDVQVAVEVDVDALGPLPTLLDRSQRLERGLQM